nr:desulfoferrodoxin family protein [uncultured Holophaga sp.]
MTQKKSVYKCDKCGSLVEALWNGPTTPSCCGQLMRELAPNTTDAATEKHVPVIEREGNQVKVKVGSVAHPMTPEHYILFVEVLHGQDVYRHDFQEGDTIAEATFLIPDDGQPLVAREYCNLHGFWASK